MSKRWPVMTDADYLARVYARCERQANGCLIWKGYCHRDGYGESCFYGKEQRVHRWVYQAIRKLTLDAKESVCHSCDTPACCEISHLWLGDQNSNTQDMVRKKRTKAYTITHCKHGHAFDVENTYLNKQGHRNCRRCQLIGMRMKAGWSREMAKTLPKTPHGYAPNKGRFPVVTEERT